MAVDWNYKQWIEANDWEISKIMDLAFHEDDIYVLVTWEPTIIDIHVRIPASDGTIQRLSNGEWQITWVPSWIPLTNLNSSTDAWLQFYNQEFLPFMLNNFVYPY